jgi:hypothetical protein
MSMEFGDDFVDFLFDLRTNKCSDKANVFKNENDLDP